MKRKTNFAALLPAEQWERNAYAVILAVFVSFTGFTLSMPFLPLYVLQLGIHDVQTAAAWSGVILGVSPLIAGVMAPIWGGLSDRYGRKPMIVRALIAFMVIMVLTGFATNVYQLLILRIFWGICGGFGAMAMAMITTSTPEEKTSTMIGRLQAAQLLSNASGPLVGGVLASTVGIRNTFFVSTTMYVVALAAVVLVFKEQRHTLHPRKPGDKRSLRKLLLLPSLIPAAVVLFLTQCAIRSWSPILPLYTQDLGAPMHSVPIWVGLISSLAAVASAASASATGRLGRSFRLKMLLVISLSGSAVAALASASVQSVVYLLASYTALGLLVGGTATLAYSIASSHLPRQSRGATMGLLSTGTMVGGGLGPFLAGAISATGLRTVFVVSAALLLVSVGVALRLPDSVRLSD